MLSHQLVNEMISKSSNKKILDEVFSDHFDNLINPVSVSLGLSLKDKNVEDIVNILRENGINALPFYNQKVKEDLNCFVVDGTGIRSPILSPEDAIQATADLFEIMEKNNIKTSRAMPVSKENMIPAIARTYHNKIIDITGNNPQEQNIKKFIQQQLEIIAKMPQADFTDKDHTNSLYRGGTLGDKPYAITPHQRKRDGVYASNNVNTSIEYADGKKGNGFSFEEIEINGTKVSYGFLYEFEKSDNQRFYGMAEIESPYGSEECKGHPDNRPDYETLITPDRNPLKAIYLKANNKVVKISDKGNYLSDNWKKFAEIHTPYNTNEKNDFLVERINHQMLDFTPQKYKKENKPLEKDISELQFDGLIFKKDITQNLDGIYEINNANISSMIPKNLNNIRFKGDFNLNNCSLSEEAGKLDLSNCSGIVGISDCDISQVKEIIPPKSCNIFFLENVNLGERNSLDLSQINCNCIVFSNQDLSSIKELKLPERTSVKYKGKTTLPKNSQANQPSDLIDINKIYKLRGLSTRDQKNSAQFKFQETNNNSQMLKLYQKQRLSR